MPADGPQPELFLGAATPAEARVYVRLLGAAAGGAARMTGHVHGPFCDFARTLPARIPFVDVAVERRLPQDAGRGEPLLAVAVVPDPCFWTPALPMRYEAVVQLAGSVDFSPHDATKPPRQEGTHVLPFGIRPLYRRGRRLVFDGQVWALRAVSAETAPDAPLADWRSAGAAMLVANPDEQLCGDADRQGVLLVADLATLSAERSLAELSRLARHPSAGFVILPDGQPFATDPRPLAAGALLCQRIDPRAAAPPAVLQPWADLALVEAADPPAAATFAAHCPLPTIAHRPLAASTDVAAARRHCDALQADLAGRADFAGYIV